MSPPSLTDVCFCVLFVIRHIMYVLYITFGCSLQTYGMWSLMYVCHVCLPYTYIFIHITYTQSGVYTRICRVHIHTCLLCRSPLYRRKQDFCLVTYHLYTFVCQLDSQSYIFINVIHTYVCHLHKNTGLSY